MNYFINSLITSRAAPLTSTPMPAVVKLVEGAIDWQQWLKTKLFMHRLTPKRPGIAYLQYGLTWSKRHLLARDFLYLFCDSLRKSRFALVIADIKVGDLNVSPSLILDGLSSSHIVEPPTSMVGTIVFNADLEFGISEIKIP